MNIICNIIAFMLSVTVIYVSIVFCLKLLKSLITFWCLVLLYVMFKVYSHIRISWGLFQTLRPVVNFEVCFGLLSRCRSQHFFSFTFLADCSTCASRICWYLMKSILPSILAVVSVPLAATQPQRRIFHPILIWKRGFTLC